MQFHLATLGLSAGCEWRKCSESLADFAKIVGVRPTAGDEYSNSSSRDDDSCCDLDDQRAPRAGVAFAEWIEPSPIVVAFAFE